MTYENCWYKQECGGSERCGAFCKKFMLMLSLVKQSNLPEVKWYPTKLSAPKDDLQSFRRLAEIKSDIENWVNCGNNLYVHSEYCGNGKTSWSIRLLLAYFNSVWDISCFKRLGIFMPMVEYSNRIKRIISNPVYEDVKMLSDLKTAKLVIWDDISIIRLTEYAYSQFYEIIDARVNSGLANIYTGNMAGDELFEFLGARLCSRIYHSSEKIRFVSGDKRGVEIVGRTSSIVEDSK